MLTKSRYFYIELTRVIFGIIGAGLMAYGLSHFFEYDFGFWPWFLFIVGFYLFPKILPKSSLDYAIRFDKLPD